jgi:hypothetical protein
MTTCDDFQIALEMQRQGALSEPDAARLDAHLASCAVCRAYAAQMGRAEATMATYAQAELTHTDWDRLGRQLRTWFRTWQFHALDPRTVEFWLAAAWIALALGAMPTRPGHPLPLLEMLLAGAAGLVLSLVVDVVKSRAFLANARKQTKTRGELMLAARMEAERRLRLRKGGLTIIPLLSVMFALPVEGTTAHSLALRAGCIAVSLVYVAYEFRVVFPRMKRDIEELK